MLNLCGSNRKLQIHKRITFLPSSKFLSLKKSLFINIKQMKSCQILISLNIHTGLVPLKRKNMPQNIVEVGWALSPPQLMNAHDQANLQQTQLKKHTGAWKAFGWISSQTSALSEKPPTACALLTVTQWHCHCFHAQHLSGYKYLGISRKQYYGTKNIQDISSFEVLMEKQCKTIP